MNDYTNSKMLSLIREHIHDVRYRKILVDRFVHGFTYERIAERNKMSVRQCKNIVYKAQEKLSKYI